LCKAWWIWQSHQHRLLASDSLGLLKYRGLSRNLKGNNLVGSSLQLIGAWFCAGSQQEAS
jgi:hypothetical protein